MTVIMTIKSHPLLIVSGEGVGRAGVDVDKGSTPLEVAHTGWQEGVGLDSLDGSLDSLDGSLAVVVVGHTHGEEGHSLAVVAGHKEEHRADTLERKRG